MRGWGAALRQRAVVAFRAHFKALFRLAKREAPEYFLAASRFAFAASLASFALRFSRPLATLAASLPRFFQSAFRNFICLPSSSSFSFLNRSPQSARIGGAPPHFWLPGKDLIWRLIAFPAKRNGRAIPAFEGFPLPTAGAGAALCLERQGDSRFFSFWACKCCRKAGQSSDFGS